MGRVDRPRLAAAALVFALVGVASYAAQRLAGAWAGEPAAAAIVATEHIAYLYRVALCALHGVIAGLLAGLLLSDDAASRLVARGPWWVAAVVVPAAVAMAAVP